MPVAAPIWDTPLQEPPAIIYAGIGRHGHAARAITYRENFWCLHVYNYEGMLDLQGESYSLGSGLVSLVPPGVEFRHTWFHPESVHVYHLFTLQETDQTMARIPLLQSSASLALAADPFDLLAEASAWLTSQPRRAVARLWEVLFALSSPQPGQTEWLPPALQLAIREIERNLHQPPSIPALARKAGISHNQLTRLFQKKFGLTVIDYIADHRWERIRRLVTATSTPLKQIAYEFSFSDLSHFNKFVRHRSGLSPRDLRERT